MPMAPQGQKGVSSKMPTSFYGCGTRLAESQYLLASRMPAAVAVAAGRSWRLQWITLHQGLPYRCMYLIPLPYRYGRAPGYELVHIQPHTCTLACIVHSTVRPSSCMQVTISNGQATISAGPGGQPGLIMSSGRPKSQEAVPAASLDAPRKAFRFRNSGGKSKQGACSQPAGSSSSHCHASQAPGSGGRSCSNTRGGGFV
eukprot:COSAG01_NODE_12144_length_1794_cov_1.602360_1_plen_199_part_10